MRVRLNGTETELPPGATVLAALGALELPADARGVAVAVDAEVVPRTAWERTPLADGADVEIVHAIQGG
jgi:sulfur carrier protein